MSEMLLTFIAPRKVHIKSQGQTASSCSPFRRFCHRHVISPYTLKWYSLLPHFTFLNVWKVMERGLWLLLSEHLWWWLCSHYQDHFLLLLTQLSNQLTTLGQRKFLFKVHLLWCWVSAWIFMVHVNWWLTYPKIFLLRNNQHISNGEPLKI